MAVRFDLFTSVINVLRRGLALAELSDALAEAVERARDTGKQASVTLKITVKPQGRDGQYAVIDDITSKLPKEEKAPTLMFGTPDGNLQRDDPKQQKMDLRSATDDKGDLRQIG